MKSGKPVAAKDLKTQNLGLEAPESSALRRLEEIHKEKEKVKAKEQSKEQASPVKTVTATQKKQNKRGHPIPPETQEAEAKKNETDFVIVKE